MTILDGDVMRSCRFPFFKCEAIRLSRSCDTHQISMRAPLRGKMSTARRISETKADVIVFSITHCEPLLSKITPTQRYTAQHSRSQTDKSV